MAVRRISIGPGEVAGYFSRLKSGFDKLGIPSEYFVLSANKFSYEESDYFLKTAFQRVTRLCAHENGIIRLIGSGLALCVRIAVFLYALFRCDVFIFSGFGSFFRFYELPLLRLLGKKVLVIYLGSDARPPIFSGRHLDDDGSYVDPFTAYQEALNMVARIRRVEKYSDVIINHTSTAQYFIKPFVRLFAVGMPIDSCLDLPSLKKNQSNTVQILHAPSRPLAKGSLIFRRIIDELRVEGYLIKFVELMGVPNSVVLQELQRCDFLVDEIYTDTPMGMIATEAAIFGKPTVTGSWYVGQSKIDNPEFDFPPSLFVEENLVKQSIRKMIEDPEFRLDLGRNAQNFIRNNWDSTKVAQNYLRLIEGDIPETWISNPSKLCYYWGWGLSKDNWQKQVGGYLSSLGDDALLLNHNQKLKEMVLNEIR